MELLNPVKNQCYNSQTKIRNRVNQTIYSIADLDESRNTISNYFINEDNDNCFSIPLEEIVSFLTLA